MGVQDEFDTIIHEPEPEFVESSNVAAFMESYDIDDYDELITQTCGNIEWFWDEIISYLDIEFYESYNAIRDDSDGPQFSRWYPGGSLNIAHNVVDRHAQRDTPNTDIACIWEGEPGDVRRITYDDLYRTSNKVANYLSSSNIGIGDTVALYMPMVPEVISILYGCFKVGAIAVPIFSGFGTEATATRLEDADASVVFTGDGFYRRGSEIPLKSTVDAAIDQIDTTVSDVVVYSRLGTDPSMQSNRDQWWSDSVKTQSSSYETKQVDSLAESMVLYSSGTTGKPKGIIHTHSGVQVQCAKELHFGFDLKPSDRFFWVSDIGWMMGPWTLIGVHTLGGTVFMYEGAPDEPNPDRYWQLIETHELTQFGISPTAIRALRKHGDEWVDKYDLSSLRLLGSTGEPWDPESWIWFYEQVGDSSCPIINISGGTEICGCFVMPMPIQPLKPCTVGGPGLGMDIDIVDDEGNSVREEHIRGYLVARDSCPSMTKSLWGGDDRYLDEYWSRFDDPPLWNHGDWAQMDADGFWFLHGRADDALNVAGRKVGPAEVEGALIEHPAVNQAAAVGVPDETTGTAVIAYVVLEPDESQSNSLRKDLKSQVATDLGKPFRPREILFVDEFPKTQSGKIIRRALQAAYTGESLGDLSSIENPDALEKIQETY